MRLAVVLLFVTVQTNAAQALPRYGIFNYADMCHSSQSGDWDGQRIVIMRLPEGDEVFYFTGEGGISVLQGMAQVDRNGGITFKLEDAHGANVGPVYFKGRMTETALAGRLGYTPNSSDPVHLLRSGEAKATNRNVDCHR